MRNIPKQRSRSPEPLALMHPSTGRAYDVENGDWVKIETRKGSIKIKLHDGVMPGVISMSHG